MARKMFGNLEAISFGLTGAIAIDGVPPRVRDGLDDGLATLKRHKVAYTFLTSRRLDQAEALLINTELTPEWVNPEDIITWTTTRGAGQNLSNFLDSQGVQPHHAVHVGVGRENRQLAETAGVGFVEARPSDLKQLSLLEIIEVAVERVETASAV